jgi:predicted neuraminidase
MEIDRERKKSVLREMFLPTDCVQNHAANLLALPDGDLLCAWFAGTQEGIPDISIYLSRLKSGATEWSAPVKLSDDPGRSEQNPVLNRLPDGSLWLFWTAQESGNQDTAIVRRRISFDNGRSWGPIEVLFDTPGTFVRQPLTVLATGEWLLPVFYCKNRPGRKWVGDEDTSAVKISRDGGKTWQERPVPDSTGCVHMNIVDLKDGSLVAFFRSRWADHIYRSRSSDRGETWTPPQPTELPNNNSSIQCVRLADGNLAMVFNDRNAQGCSERRLSLYDDIGDNENLAPQPSQCGLTAEKKTAFWGVPRAPMTVAISEDAGVTWPFRQNLDTGDGYCMTNNSIQGLNREYSYPSVIQTPDGVIHIAYTYFRQKIKYVAVTEAWVAGSARG